MASTEFSLDAATKSLCEDGYLVLNDPEIGKLVREMEQKGFQHLSLLSPYGFEYCKQHVFRHPLIVPILESLLDECSLGHWLRYKALPGHIECFRKGGREAGLRVLIVQQWAKGSHVDYYRGSHLLDLPTEKGIRDLHETTRTALHEAGCHASEEAFPDGGLVIRDARLYSEIKTEYGIHLLFARDKVPATWPKVILPNSPDLVRKFVKMETSKIRVNFAIDSTGKAIT